MFLIDKQYLLKTKFDVTIHKTKQSIRIHDIDDKLHDNSKYTELNFYVVDTLSNQSSIIVHFRREIHLVNDLRIHALLDVVTSMSEISIENLSYQREFLSRLVKI